MHFVALVIALNVLLASTMLAIPSPRYGVRAARRRDGNRSQLNNRIEQSTSTLSEAATYSYNWAGAIWDKGDGMFTSVTGTFIVPTPSGGNDSAASIWVGIDGDTCTSAILQTGIEFTLSNGEASFSAWYEWYPAAAHDFTGINISGGDIVRLTVTTSSATSGNATVENLTNGQSVSQSLTSTTALCQRNSEWIVEDFQQNGGLAPLANFTIVTFTDAEATGNGSYTPLGANIVNIRQNNQVLTSVSTSDSSVTVQYV